jgi:thiol-disulfide isomerase/thioredoxin
MRKMLLFSFILIGTHTMAQNESTVPTRFSDEPASDHVTKTSSDFDVMKDEKNGMIVYKGQITFENIKKEKSFNWFPTGVKQYKPDAAQTAYLQQHLGDYDMVIFMGTWCSDSHDVIPKLYKVLEQAYYKGKYLMYGTDLAKTTKTDAYKVYGITLVPTIILMKNGKEAGRITESVKTSVEGDLAEIIRKDK